MPRLTRVHQKVFASNASNNGVFGSLQAGNPQTSNDVATLQSLSAFENGWDDAIEQGDKLPPLEEFQGIQYGISYQQAYMLQEGIAEWDASTPYYKGSLAKTISGSSFKLYCSLADNNTGKIVTNTSYWKLVMDSDAGYFILNSNNTASGNNVWTGSNIFKSIYENSSDLVKGTTPSSNTYVGLYFCDKNGTNHAENQVGQLQLTYSTDGAISVKMNCLKPLANSTESASLGVGYESDGTTQFASASSGVKKSIVGWAMPKYTSRTSYTKNSAVPSNGYVFISLRPSSDEQEWTISVNSYYIYHIKQRYRSKDPYIIPVQKGDKVNWSGSFDSNPELYFVPCVGG